eukprot:8726669-Pyramimonas_sp.AAC.1
MFSLFREILPEALSFDTEHSHACKELYEVPGSDQVDGWLGTGGKPSTKFFCVFAGTILATEARS